MTKCGEHPRHFKNFVSDKECGFYAKFFWFQDFADYNQIWHHDGLSAMEVQFNN